MQDRHIIDRRSAGLLSFAEQPCLRGRLDELLLSGLLWWPLCRRLRRRSRLWRSACRLWRGGGRLRRLSGRPGLHSRLRLGHRLPGCLGRRLPLRLSRRRCGLLRLRSLLRRPGCCRALRLRGLRRSGRRGSRRRLRLTCRGWLLRLRRRLRSAALWLRWLLLWLHRLFSIGRRLMGLLRGRGGSRCLLRSILGPGRGLRCRFTARHRVAFRPLGSFFAWLWQPWREPRESVVVAAHAYPVYPMSTRTTASVRESSLAATTLISV